MAASEYQVVRLKAGKITFEVLCKPGHAAKFREGKLGWDSVLYADDVFAHAGRGERAKPGDIAAAFGSPDVVAAAQRIVRTGDIQLSAAERAEKARMRRLEVVNYIHKYYLDPRSKTPHPVTRIENALDTLKFHAEPDLPLERQIAEIVKRLPDVMPVRRAEIEAVLIVPNAHVGQAAGVVPRFAKVARENYTEDGCRMEITLVPGDYDSLVAELAKVTKGDFQLEVVGAEKAAASSEDASAAPSARGSRGGKRGGRGGRGGKGGR